MKTNMPSRKPKYSSRALEIRHGVSGNGRQCCYNEKVLLMSLFAVILILVVFTHLQMKPNGFGDPFTQISRSKPTTAFCSLATEHEHPPAWIELTIPLADAGVPREAVYIDRFNGMKKAIHPLNLSPCRLQNCRTRAYLHDVGEMLLNVSRSETDIIVLSTTDVYRNKPFYMNQVDMISLHSLFVRDSFKAIAFPDAEFGISSNVIVTTVKFVYELQKLALNACLDLEGTSLFYRCLFQLLCIHIDILGFEFFNSGTKHSRTATEITCQRVNISNLISLEEMVSEGSCKQDCHTNVLKRYPNICGLLSECVNLKKGWEGWNMEKCGGWHEGDGPNIPFPYVNLILKRASLYPSPPKWLSLMNPGDLLCTAVLQPTSKLLPSVVKMLKGCDHFLIFSNTSLEHSGVNHTVISWNGSMQVPYGGKFHSALNTPIFVNMYFDWLANNIHKPVWIAKVDPDTFLIPRRLKHALKGSVFDPDFPVISGKGCGPLEILSTGALRKYLEVRNQCEQGALLLYPQEDLYMEKCFTSTSTKVSILNFQKHGILSIEELTSLQRFDAMERECKRSSSNYTYAHPFKQEKLHNRLVENCLQAS